MCYNFLAVFHTWFALQVPRGVAGSDGRAEQIRGRARHGERLRRRQGVPGDSFGGEVLVECLTLVVLSRRFYFSCHRTATRLFGGRGRVTRHYLAQRLKIF